MKIDDSSSTKTLDANCLWRKIGLELDGVNDIYIYTGYFTLNDGSKALKKVGNKIIEEWETLI